MSQFKKGQSGNPGGRPKSKPFTDALRIAVLEADGDTTKLRRIAAKLTEMAISGDIQAIREIFDRLEGKAHQSVELNDNRSELSDEERSARIIELLERRGAIGAAGAPGEGQAEGCEGQPEGIRPLH
jgi:hypothetical protein